MQSSTRSTIESTFKASNEGRIHFGDVIRQLMSVQVEAYWVDYRSARSTYYLPDGQTLDLVGESNATPIGNVFDTAVIRATIKAAQQGQVMYPEFKRLTLTAGCIGYMVWIAGRHVSYFGRQGEVHVERFPD